MARVRRNKLSPKPKPNLNPLTLTLTLALALSLTLGAQGAAVLLGPVRTRGQRGLLAPALRDPRKYEHSQGPLVRVRIRLTLT